MNCIALLIVDVGCRLKIWLEWQKDDADDAPLIVGANADDAAVDGCRTIVSGN